MGPLLALLAVQFVPTAAAYSVAQDTVITPTDDVHPNDRSFCNDTPDVVRLMVDGQWSQIQPGTCSVARFQWKPFYFYAESKYKVWKGKDVAHVACIFPDGILIPGTCGGERGAKSYPLIPYPSKGRAILSYIARDPVRMLPPEGSFASEAPTRPMSLKVICAATDAAGKIVTSHSEGESNISEDNCVPMQIDDWDNYVVDMLPGKWVQICGVDDQAVRRACTAKELLGDNWRDVRSPSREGFARLGYRIGAWAGGMPAHEASNAKQGEGGVPITAYIGQDFGAGAYEAMIRRGEGDRAALILFPIATAWWNSPSHQAVLKGDFKGLVKQASEIGRAELRNFDKRRIEKINEILKPIQEAKKLREKAEECIRTLLDCVL